MNAAQVKDPTIKAYKTLAPNQVCITINGVQHFITQDYAQQIAQQLLQAAQA